MEKRVSLLDFDLNVAPPEDGGSPPPTAADGGFDLNEIARVNDEVLDGEIRAHSVTDSEIEIAEEETKIRRWNALLEASEGALSAYGDGKAQNRRRRASRGEAVRIGGELVVRSTRGRTVAMPNKYRDSFLDAAAVAAVAAARFSPINGKRKAR